MSLLLDFIFFPVAYSFKKDKPGPESLKILHTRQQERERISADIHDEIGSGICAIRMMSEIAMKKLKPPIPIELERISRSAEDLLVKLHAIIWSMHGSNDSLESMCCYIKSTSLEYFESTSIECSIQLPVIIPVLNIDGEMRRNICLSVKESLTNILKHALATKVEILITCQPVFKIQISDNGRGITVDNLRPFGNGIRNMKTRMKNVNGNFKMENQNGTTVIFEIPLT